MIRHYLFIQPEREPLDFRTATTADLPCRLTAGDMYFGLDMKTYLVRTCIVASHSDDVYIVCYLELAG